MSLGARKRLVVLGLDGVGLPWARAAGDRLPNLARLAKGAVPMEAEAPELSPVNWTSFFTAEGPERHGIFGFSSINPRTYELSINDSGAVQTPTVFERLSDQGLACRVVNLPGTYPARPLRGLMVSGFVARDLDRAAYPPGLASTLAAMGYILEADTSRAAADPDGLLAGLHATLESRAKALDAFFADQDFDLFVFVLTETDRLFHFLYPATLNPAHPLHLDCLVLLKKWDGLIGRLLDRYDALPGPKRLMVLADHGFTELETEADVNARLREAGLLSLVRAPAHEWDAGVVHPDSLAFALDPGRVYVHDSGRFSRGGVAPADRLRVAEDIRQALISLEYRGEPAMEAVVPGHELYPDCPFEQAPDLVCLARPGVDLKAKFDREEVFGRFGRTGTHTRTDVLFHDTDGAKPARVRDTGRLVLEWLQGKD